MRIAVTGAGGMLGHDLARAAKSAGHEVHAFTRAELDITNERAVADRLAEARPDAVVNCAAWTDVDGAEADPGGAMRVNAAGADVLASVAERLGASIVHPSTDYVFDGSKREPYVESDPVGPESAYGESKRAGERAIAERTPRHFIVRSSWLFGLNGRNFVDTMLGLARERGEVRVVADQVGCPTYSAHLAEALVALAESDAYGVHHVAGGGSCSWFELAVEAFRREGVHCRAEAVTTAEFPRPAPRPAYSVLRTERDDGPAPLPDWTDGLDAYLAERKAYAPAART